MSSNRPAVPSIRNERTSAPRRPPFALSLLALVPILALFGLLGAAFPAACDTGTVLWISDIHFDPFYEGPKDDDSDAEAVIRSLVDLSGSEPAWIDADRWAAVLGQAGTSQSECYSIASDDTNFKLFTEVLGRARQIEPDPDFILITGDFLGHDFGGDYARLAPQKGDLPAPFEDVDMAGSLEDFRSFVRHTLDYIALSIRDRYPLKAPMPGALPDGPPVYAALGNNDADCGDYVIHLGGGESTFLADAQEIFLEHFLVGQGVPATDLQAFKKTFPLGGYYTVTPRRSPNNRLVLLNSVPFLAGYPDDAKGHNYPDISCLPANAVDVGKQLDWLFGTAATATHPAIPGQIPAGGGRAWIAAHVPPGVDCYGNRNTYTGSQYWDSASTDAFTAGFSAQRAGIAGMLTAHTHSNELKVVRDDTAAYSFVLLAPSVSPNHGNNASFRVMRYDRDTLAILDYDTHYKNLYPSTDTMGLCDGAGPAMCETAGTCWEHFAFGKGYGVDAVDAASLDLVTREFGNGDKAPIYEYARDLQTRAGVSRIGGSGNTQKWASFPRCVSSLDGSFTCAAAGASCSAASECCLGSCTGGVCSCAGSGDACTGDADCCSGSCTSGACGP